MVNRELYMSYIRGRITAASVRLISGCKSKYLFKKEIERAVYKWGVKTGTNETIRLFREVD